MLVLASAETVIATVVPTVAAACVVSTPSLAAGVRSQD
jgi:hypothetical protein